MENAEILNQINAAKTKPKGQFNGLLVLLVSLVLFAGLGFFKWDLRYLTILAVIIFIHECGHLLAMRLYKYKNLKMMFLPFLGGIASGESDEQNSYKIAMISIFGPFIGIISSIISAIIYMFTAKRIFLDYATLSLYLNVFNLLPVLPLDGGQYFNEALLSRYPKAEFVFKLCGAIALGYFAYKMEAFLLGVISFFIFRSLKSSYLEAVAISELRQNSSLIEGDLTEDKINIIRDSICAATPISDIQLPMKINSAWIKLQKSFPSVKATVFLIFVYFFVLAIFVPFTFGFIQGGNQHVAENHGQLYSFGASKEHSLYYTPEVSEEDARGVTVLLRGSQLLFSNYSKVPFEAKLKKENDCFILKIPVENEQWEKQWFMSNFHKLEEYIRTNSMYDNFTIILSNLDSGETKEI